nr:glycoside hydrolase family 9 protein [Kribbella sandramycini]
MQRQTLSDVLNYFKAMRSSGEIDRKDRAAKLWADDSGRTVDARGGWLDASGDTSKFLSHLTYTSTMSPQQIPLCVWAMIAARDAIAANHPELVKAVSTRLRDEALFGADFLVRFRSADGYFYTGIFDALTKNLDERFINAPLQNSVRTPRYQAGYRQGGGLAIAALARAATLDDDGDFPRTRYLKVAEQAFHHLEAHNLEYLFDGEESVLDDYTALLAAAELVAAGIDSAAPAAARRAAALIDRYADGHFVADAKGRPFFHAAEAGLPVLALLRYAEACPADAVRARSTAVRAMLDLLDRTHAVPNPFGYPRQLVQPTDDEAHAAFFFPHANETGYWWQGENATIASLSAAASACAALDELDPADRARLKTFAADQLHWILGRNPFDSSMLQGRGRNNPEYSADFPNVPGGIANGITSGWTDENDVALLPADAPPGEVWRWAEQWIPHTGWFLLAVAH